MFLLLSTVESGYNDSGLYTIISVVSVYSVVHINSTLLTIMLATWNDAHFNDSKHPVPLMTSGVPRNFFHGGSTNSVDSGQIERVAP
jgi:hypothetical protein